MNKIRFVLILFCSFVLCVYFLSCTVEDTTAPENCAQFDSTFGEYDIFREQYSENATPMSPCDTGPESGTVSFDGNKFIIEYQNSDDQKVKVTYNVVSAGN